jgi:hypothetical protein
MICILQNVLRFTFSELIGFMSFSELVCFVARSPLLMAGASEHGYAI